MAQTMRTTINAFEVLEMADRIEKNGASFYRKAAAQVDSQDVRHVLLNLAAAEEQHLQVFDEMREQLRYEERNITLFEPLSEIAEYLATLADSKVFDLHSDFSIQLAGKETLSDIVKIAIDKEKDSIIFYLGLRDFVPPLAGREKIDAIIREEMGHINILSRQMEHCE